MVSKRLQGGVIFPHHGSDQRPRYADSPEKFIVGQLITAWLAVPTDYYRSNRSAPVRVLPYKPIASLLTHAGPLRLSSTGATTPNAGCNAIEVRYEGARIH
jgi:hypothetical protein